MKLKYKRLSLLTDAMVLLLSSVTLNLLLIYPASALRSIIFPIIGPARFSNDFYAPRGNGIHGATDIFANKMQKIVSPVNGTITFVPSPQPSYGYMISIRDSENYRYNFIHLNNDSPGTDSGSGGEMHAYAPDMKPGNPVVKGQHIGYVGDSGNAENTAPHLHFEIIKPNGTPENPYDSLVRAKRVAEPALYPALPNEFLPYGAGYGRVLNIAMGNLDLDVQSEQITAPSEGGTPHVKFFDSNNTVIGGFFAYSSTFRGGVDVAAGDVDGDGIDEIITGPGPGGGPHVKVFKLDGTAIGGFLVYPSQYRDGIRVAAGDVDGDGNDEIITGAGRGSGPHVQIFETNGTLVNSFFAYDSRNRDGIDVASANIAGSVNDEIITAPGAGSGPYVAAFSSDGTALSGFFAYNSRFRGGVRVSAGNVRTATPYAEIVTVPALAGDSQVKMFNATGGGISSTIFLETWWRGYYDVAAGYDQSKAATGGNRRSSVRPGVD